MEYLFLDLGHLEGDGAIALVILRLLGHGRTGWMVLLLVTVLILLVTVLVVLCGVVFLGGVVVLGGVIGALIVDFYELGSQCQWREGSEVR